MYCRTCGNKMNDNAEICVKCGVRKNVGTDYCQVCGTRTTATMTNCKKCGAKLMKAMSSTQIKKKAVSKGKRTVGNILLFLGICLLIGMAANLIAGILEDNMYYAMDSFSGAGRCALLGGLFTGFGIRLRKKK